MYIYMNLNFSIRVYCMTIMVVYCLHWPNSYLHLHGLSRLLFSSLSASASLTPVEKKVSKVKEMVASNKPEGRIWKACLVAERKQVSSPTPPSIAHSLTSEADQM